MINGVSELSMMKADVLSSFDKIKVCTHYKINGEVIDYLPFDINDVEIEPIYEELQG
jgi:adenylosuccinate synthase